MLQGSYQATEPVRFLRGDWSVRRLITDRRAGRDGLFTGRATFRPANDESLDYTEEGELRYGDHVGPATRRLSYRADGGILDVRFADGRPFYRLDLRAESWDAEHPCGNDLYTVTGRITGPDEFTEFWHAGGPAKDYDLATTYTRVTAGPRP